MCADMATFDLLSMLEILNHMRNEPLAERESCREPGCVPNPSQSTQKDKTEVTLTVEHLRMAEGDGAFKEMECGFSIFVV